jgi:uncharacterized membrane protein
LTFPTTEKVKEEIAETPQQLRTRRLTVALSVLLAATIGVLWIIFA